jgi:hypothetical protein
MNEKQFFFKQKNMGRNFLKYISAKKAATRFGAKKFGYLANTQL